MWVKFNAVNNRLLIITTAELELQGIRRRNLDMSNFHFRLWT